MDGDEGTEGPRAAGMNGPRQHSFARAALAAEKNRRLGGSRFEGQGERLLHGGLASLQIGFRHDRANLLFEFFDVRLQAAQLRDAIEHEPDLSRRERLGRKSIAPRRIASTADSMVA